MLTFFRKILTSRIGAFLGIAFVGLLGLLFAAGDVGGMFSGPSGVTGSRVATVGKVAISEAALSQAATNALERIKQDDPTMSMKAFLASGGLDKVLNEMIDRAAVAEFGKAHGITASDRLVDSEITQIAAFKGPDGKFSQDLFRQALQQQGLSEKSVREDLTQELIARQVLYPASYGAIVPKTMAQRYVSLLTEKRTGAIAVLPSVLFAPKKAPSEAELAAYYKAHRDDFIRPERRVIRYASFGIDALKDTPQPTDAEIAAQYNADKAEYAALETRAVTQLIVPTQAAAKAVVAELGQGKSLEESAKAKGLETASLDAMSKDALASQSSPSVADAVFAAGKGAIATPAKGALGWYVMRVNRIETRPARSLDQVRGEISAALAATKRRAALTAMLGKIEDEFDNGGNLPDAAKELGLTPQQTQPLTANGQVYLKPGENAPDAVSRIIKTAFSMDRENEPQIAEVDPGKTFVIFDVTDIEDSAPAPFKDITDDVKSIYMLKKGLAAAKQAAQQVQASVKKGEDFGKAMAALKKPLPPVQPVNMGREDLARMQQQSKGQVPPPLALLFSMAEGTIKILPAPMDRGWFIVSLKDIVPGKTSGDDKLLASAEQELGQVTGSEYSDALRQAIRAEIAVTRNKAGIDAVRKKLGGDN